jgi:hypothetical protein
MVARSIDCTGFTGTLSLPASTSISLGDATAGASNIAMKTVAGMTYTIGSTTTSVVNFISTSATQQDLTTGGKTWPSYTINGVGSSYKLTDSNTVSTASLVNLTQGTFNTNGQTCSWGLLKTGGTSGQPKVFTFGASSISLTGTVGTILDMTVGSTGVTLNAGTSVLQTVNANVTLQFSNLTYYDILLPGTTTSINGIFTCHDFKCQPAAGTGFLINISANFTVTGTLTLKCTSSGTNSPWGYIGNTSPSTATTPRTITAAAVDLQQVNFADIIAAGAAIPWTSAGLIGDALGNSNITFQASRTLYWVGTAGTWNTLNRWSLSSGGATGNTSPAAHDDVIIDANSAIGTGTQGVDRVLGRNISLNTASSAFTWSHGLSPAMIFGNLALKSGMTISGTGQVALCGRGSHTLTSNGVTFANTQTNAIQIAAFGGSYTLQDNLNISNAASALLLGAGWFDANGFNVIAGLFSATSSNTKTISMGSGTWTLNGTGTVISISDVGLTMNSGTATVNITDTSATSKTINLPNAPVITSQTINKLVVASGTGMIIMTSAGTSAGHTSRIETLVLNAPLAVQWQSSQTWILSTLTAVGSAGNLITFTASTAGTQATLSKSSGIVSCNYLSIQDSAATGGAAFYAGANSTNVSNNTGWIFTSVAAPLTMMGIG